MTAGIITADAAERMVRAACDGWSQVRYSRQQRRAAEDSVVILDCEEWGTVQLEPGSFSDTQWWFDCLYDGQAWLVWYDGESDTWEAALHEHVHDVSQADGVELHRGVEPLRLHSLDREVTP